MVTAVPVDVGAVLVGVCDAEGVCVAVWVLTVTTAVGV
jgi:hypothetical protein